MDTTQAGKVTLTLTERDVWIIRAALQEYLASFSHTEGSLVEEIKALLERLPKVGDPKAAVNQVFPDARRLTL
jgi:hypothetical protein